MGPSTLRAALASMLVVIVSACGFHLAGQRPLAPELKTVYVDTITPYKVSEPPVESQLRVILLRRGAQIAESAGPEVTTIRLSDLNESREALSIGTDGKAIEFRLITRVHYEVFRGTTPLVTPGDLVATRDYSFEPQQVLAKEAEELRLRQFIQHELAELLMLRIDAALTYHSATVDRSATVAPAVQKDAAPAP